MIFLYRWIYFYTHRMTPWKSSLHGVLSTTLMLTLANRGFTLVILPVIYGPSQYDRAYQQTKFAISSFFF